MPTGKKGKEPILEMTDEKCPECGHRIQIDKENNLRLCSNTICREGLRECAQIYFAHNNKFEKDKRFRKRPKKNET